MIRGLELTHEEKAQLLLAELNEIHIDNEVRHTLNELSYTAYETGVIDVKLHEPIIIAKLVKLAEKFRQRLPDELRM